MKKVFDFVKNSGYYFLATTEGDQPRVRPFSSLVIFEGKIYFQTGKVKNVSKQIMANPKIEICAYDGKGTWIRIQAVAVEDDRLEAKQAVLDAVPELKTMYSADDGNTQVFYLKDATANVASFTGDNWSETF
ncbi:MAG: pyridoxamine 5'-phosphate oxidase family protein [Deltaproteobacteria bacterium]|nr:pyridoxamine 5'-phosphate oxidase family protein [Deltaproteobacteria bacterium]